MVGAKVHLRAFLPLALIWNERHAPSISRLTTQYIAPGSHWMERPLSSRWPRNSSALEPPETTGRQGPSPWYPQDGRDPEPPVTTGWRCPGAPSNHRMAGPYSRWRKGNCLLIPEIKALFHGPQITGCTNK